MNSKEGFVYILISPNTECIKIGGSDFFPMKRIKEINASSPYKNIGHWQILVRLMNEDL